MKIFSGHSIFETYYNSSLLARWHNYISYHPLFAVGFYIWGKITIYAWSFVDILIITICRAVSHQFKILDRTIANQWGVHFYDKTDSWITTVQNYTPQNNADTFLLQLKQQYLKIREVAQNLGNFLSPILLTLYCINFICISSYVRIKIGVKL